MADAAAGGAAKRRPPSRSPADTVSRLRRRRVGRGGGCQARAAPPSAPPLKPLEAQGAGSRSRPAVDVGDTQRACDATRRAEPPLAFATAAPVEPLWPAGAPRRRRKRRRSRRGVTAWSEGASPWRWRRRRPMAPRHRSATQNCAQVAAATLEIRITHARRRRPVAALVGCQCSKACCAKRVAQSVSRETIERRTSRSRWANLRS